MDSYGREKRRIFQHFSRSTRFSLLRTAPNPKFRQKLAMFSSLFFFFFALLQNFVFVSSCCLLPGRLLAARWSFVSRGRHYVRVFASRLEFSRDVFRCGTVDLVFHAFPDLFRGRLGVRAPGCSGATRARLLEKKEKKRSKHFAIFRKIRSQEECRNCRFYER